VADADDVFPPPPANLEEDEDGPTVWDGTTADMSFVAAFSAARRRAIENRLGIQRTSSLNTARRSAIDDDVLMQDLPESVLPPMFQRPSASRATDRAVLLEAPVPRAEDTFSGRAGTQERVSQSADITSPIASPQTGDIRSIHDSFLSLIFSYRQPSSEEDAEPTPLETDGTGFENKTENEEDNGGDGDGDDDDEDNNDENDDIDENYNCYDDEEEEDEDHVQEDEGDDEEEYGEDIDDGFQYNHQRIRLSSNDSPMMIDDEEDAMQDEDDDASEPVFDLAAARRHRLEQEQQRSSSTATQIKQKKWQRNKLASAISSSRRCVLEHFVSSVHERRLLTMIRATQTGKFTDCTDPRCHELVEIYRSNCAPLHKELRRAAKSAKETAARIREYKLASKSGDDSRKRRLAVLNNEFCVEDYSFEIPHESAQDTAVAITRLADLGRVLALRCDNVDTALITQGFADALILAMATTFRCDPRAFRSSALALRTLCARSGIALRETHAAIMDLNFHNGRRLDRITALHVALRDVLCAPPNDLRDANSAWRAHVSLAARIAMKISAQARSSAELSEAVLRPCLAVICRLAGECIRDKWNANNSEINDLATDALGWIRHELRCSGSLSSSWLSPDRARDVLLLSRILKAWRSVCPLSQGGSSSPMDTTTYEEIVQSKQHWLLDAITNEHNSSVRRQAAILILTGGKFIDTDYACLESAWSMVATAGSTASPQLLAVVSELVLNANSTTVEYLRRRGLQCFCCRLVRDHASDLLRQDLVFTTSRNGGGTTAAAVAASRPLEALNMLSTISAKLKVSLGPSRLAATDNESSVNWQERAKVAVECASKESLHVPIEAGLALFDLQLLRSKETETAAEILLAQVAMAPMAVLQKKSCQEKQSIPSVKNLASSILSSRIGRSLSGLLNSNIPSDAIKKNKGSTTPESRSVEERLAFLAAATKILRRRRALLEAQSSQNDLQEIQPRRVEAMRVLAGLSAIQSSANTETRLAAALSANAIETLLEMMSEAACPKRVKSTVLLELRRASTQDEYFRGNLPRTAISVDDIPRIGAQENKENDEDDDTEEPTMGDLRAKIAADLDMASAADMLELLVCERIVSLSLPIRLVYKKLWLPRARAAASARSRRSQLVALHGDAVPRVVMHECDDEDEDEEEDIVHHSEAHMVGDEDCEEDNDEDDDEEQDEGGLPAPDDGDEDEDDEMMEEDGGDAAPTSFRRGRRTFRLSTASDEDEDDEVPQSIHMDEDEDAVHVSTSQRSGSRAFASTNRKHMPPMIVTYRLTGVDGEATEERVDSLDSGPATEAAEDRYGATAAIVAAGGLHELAALAADVSELEEEGVTSRALALLRQCVNVDRHATALAEMGAPAALLGRLVRALRVGGNNKDRDVERLLSLLERLAPAMRDDAGEVQNKSVDIDTSNSSSHLETLVDGLRDARVAAALDRTPALRRAVCRLLPALAVGKDSAADSLASRTTDWMRRPEQWARCFSETTAVLTDDAASAAHLDLVEASCLRETVEGLGDHATAPGAAELGDALERAGFVTAACQALAERLPNQAPLFPWLSSEDDEDRIPAATWTAAIGAVGVGQVLLASLRALRGACAASRNCAIACLEADALEMIHFLEQLTPTSTRDVGLAAEACLDAVACQDSVNYSIIEDETSRGLNLDAAGARVRHLRAVTKRQRITYAHSRRAKLLNRLGLTEPPSAIEVSTAPPIASTIENEDNEPCLTCVVCREDSKPRDVLCAYIYTKLAVADVGDADGAFLLGIESGGTASGSISRQTSGGTSTAISRFARGGTTSSGSRSISRQRRRYGVVSSVSAWNLIHSSCHREATRAERNLRSPRSEWDGATLRNSRVLCNSFIPLRPSAAIGSDATAATTAYNSALDRHFASMSQLGVSARSSSSSSSSEAPTRFTVVLHDARLLLLRLAHREQLHSESGGGSRASNIMLLCYLLQLATHLLVSNKPADSPDRDHLRRIVDAFASQASSALSRNDDHQENTDDNRQRTLAEADNKTFRSSEQLDYEVVEQDNTQDDDDNDDNNDEEPNGTNESLRLLAAHETPPPTPVKKSTAKKKRDRQRAELLGRLAEAAPYIALLSLFNNEQQFSELKVIFATFAARRGLVRAETRAAAREQSRLRSASDVSVSSIAAGPPPVSGAYRTMDTNTRQRARSYARSMLAYIALLDRFRSEICLSSVQDENRISILEADDAAIANAASNLTTFYESVLLEAPDARTVLVDRLQIQPEALSLSSDVQNLLFPTNSSSSG